MNVDFDFDHAVSAPFRMQPGLRRVDPAHPQLTPVMAASLPVDALSEKLAALRDHWDRALLCRPDFDPTPALTLLIDELAAHYPNAWQRVATGHSTARQLGWTLIGDQLRAEPGAIPEVGPVIEALPSRWRLAGLISLAFEEDFAIVDGRDATIPWMAVCLPSFWAPETKAGHHFTAIHEPVADAQLVIAAGERLMRLVCNPQRWERYVWTLTPHPRLRAHPVTDQRAPWPAQADANALAALSFLRTERQTFIPLPSLTQAVFTIHVQRQPLAAAVAIKGRARRLHDALASMSDAVLAYRGLTEARQRLLAWLAARADADDAGASA